jgi:hypothetical protein
MALNENALFDEDYWDQMWDGADVDPLRLEGLINAGSTAFEMFCNRKLKARTFTYVEADHDPDNGVVYDPDYTIFDAPSANVFWFPTYPVNELAIFSVSGDVLSASTTYYADLGYILYGRAGKLIYDVGFDYGYRQNILTVWNGGYTEDSTEMALLQYLLYIAIKDMINAQNNQTYESERIGGYQYKVLAPGLLAKMQGLSPKVFSDLSKFKKVAFA